MIRDHNAQDLVRIAMLQLLHFEISAMALMTQGPANELDIALLAQTLEQHAGRLNDLITSAPGFAEAATNDTTDQFDPHQLYKRVLSTLRIADLDGLAEQYERFLDPEHITWKREEDVHH